MNRSRRNVEGNRRERGIAGGRISGAGIRGGGIGEVGIGKGRI